MTSPATAKQLRAICFIVSDRAGIAPWNLSDKKSIAWLNEHLAFNLDDARPLWQQLSITEASNLIDRLHEFSIIR